MACLMVRQDQNVLNAIPREAFGQAKRPAPNRQGFDGLLLGMRPEIPDKTTKSGLRATARCVLYYNTILARGLAARPRCIPQAVALPGHRTHSRARRSYRRSITRRAWRSASPPAPNHARTSGRPITNQGSVPAPPDTPMTISSRPTLRGLDAAILPKMDHSRGSVATPKPSSSDLETCLSTDTEPCTIYRPIDQR